MLFKCDSCGLCCLRIESILPEFALKDGSCCYLNKETNVCKIYSDRPLKCNVSKFYDRTMKYFISEDRYYTNQAIMCELIKENKKWQLG